MNRSIQSGCIVPPSQCVHTSWRRCCLSRRATSSPVPSLLPEILKPVLATVADDSSRPSGGERDGCFLSNGFVGMPARGGIKVLSQRLSK